MADVRYLPGDRAELIVCRESAISYPLHNHVSMVTMGVVLDGEIELTVGGVSRVCRENDGFLLLPYVPHSINAKSRYTLLSLCVDKNRASPDEFKEMEMRAFLRGAVHQPEAENRLLEMLTGFALHDQIRDEKKKVDAFELLKASLEMQPERRCSLEDMAEQAFMSKYHLLRTFKREVGLTPHQFQIQNRVRKAQRMMRAEASVAEAASAAGFCDQSHFIRCFKRVVGLTPSDYKRCCRVCVPVVTQGPG